MFSHGFLHFVPRKEKEKCRKSGNQFRQGNVHSKQIPIRPPDLVLGTEKAAATAEGEVKTFFSCDRRRGQSLFFPFPYPRPTMAAIFQVKENAPIPKSNPFTLIFGHFSKNTSNIFAVGFSTFCGITVFLGNFCRNYLQKNDNFCFACISRNCKCHIYRQETVGQVFRKEMQNVYLHALIGIVSKILLGRK